MAKRMVYSFAERKHSVNGIASAIMSLFSIMLLISLLAIAYFTKGTANSWAGAVGVTAIILAFMGISYGLAGFKSESKSYFCCKLGTIVGTISIAAWFFIVCIGIAN